MSKKIDADSTSGIFGMCLGILTLVIIAITLLIIK